MLLLAAACQTAPLVSPLNPISDPAAAASTVSSTEPGAVAPDLDSLAWDDRSPFRAGLVAAQQPILDMLPGAPVYHIAISVTSSLDTVPVMRWCAIPTKQARRWTRSSFIYFPIW